LRVKIEILQELENKNTTFFNIDEVPILADLSPVYERISYD